MCGRFTQHYTWAEVNEFLSVFGAPPNLQPRYNIAPTTTIDVVQLDVEGRRELVRMRWGLVPFFWKKPLKERMRFSRLIDGEISKLILGSTRELVYRERSKDAGMKLYAISVILLCFGLMPTTAFAGSCSERQEVCLAYCSKTYSNAPKCLRACLNYTNECMATGCWESKITAKQCGFTRG